MVGIVGVSLVPGVELIFWGWGLCRWDRVWVVLCCIVSLLCVWILLVSSFGSEYGVLIQCVPLVCRSISAFLLSVCMSVWSISSICMYATIQLCVVCS